MPYTINGQAIHPWRLTNVSHRVFYQNDTHQAGNTANIFIRPLKCKNVIFRAFVDGVDSKNVFVGVWDNFTDWID